MAAGEGPNTGQPSAEQPRGPLLPPQDGLPDESHNYQAAVSSEKGAALLAELNTMHSKAALRKRAASMGIIEEQLDKAFDGPDAKAALIDLIIAQASSHDFDDIYDFVVTGAGSAGAILATRLSEDPRISVCLLEAGAEPPPAASIPAACASLQHNPAADWEYTGDAGAGQCLGLNPPGRMHAPRGKCLGGSSSINYCAFVRGHPGDFDEWARNGAPGWGFHDVLPFFKKLETFNEPKHVEDEIVIETEAHGKQGPLNVSIRNPIQKSTEVFLDACKAHGLPLIDYNGTTRGGPQGGASHTHFSAKKGLRQSSYTAFLQPVMDRPNLKVLTGAYATKVKLDGLRAVGVEYQLASGESKVARVSKELVVSNGAYNTPALLLRSGIGPKAELDSVGVPCLLDQTHVGKHMKDHLMAIFIHPAPGLGKSVLEVFTSLGPDALKNIGALPAEDATLTEEQKALKSNADNQLRELLTEGQGLAGSSLYDAVAFYNTRLGDHHTHDAQLAFLPCGYNKEIWAGIFSYNIEKYFGTPQAADALLATSQNVMLIAHIVKPRSEGEVRLASADAMAQPSIHFNYLSDTEGHDVKVFKSVCKRALEIGKGMSGLGPVYMPQVLRTKHSYQDGDEITDAILEDYVKHFPLSVYHATSTCRMGDVLDECLRVRGIDRLRVADASAMPNIISGNTNAPCLMIGEKAAEIIATEYRVGLKEFVGPVQQSQLAVADTSTTLQKRTPPAQLAVVVRDREGHEVHLMTGRGQPLLALMKAACGRFNMKESTAVFHFHGKEVLGTDTAQSLQMGEGSVLVVSIAPQVAAHQLAPVVERPVLDLEVRCPACFARRATSTAKIMKNPEMQCLRCGQVRVVEIMNRPVTAQREMGRDGRPNTADTGTSGDTLIPDFDGQHIEAPVGGMLALVTQVQRERLCVGAFCYFFFCLNFIIISTMARPVHKMFELQSSIHSELISEVIPGASGRTFNEIANWGDFWQWVDGVLVEKVYGESYWSDVTGNVSHATRAPYSQFTVGKYNRVSSAIRFRQVRVKPTLPRCKRNSFGVFPTIFEQSCSRQDNVDKVYSCHTPVASHSLSRPCWGNWKADQQDNSYPGSFMLASSKNTLKKPQWNLLCLQNCDAYFLEGRRTKEEHPPFGLPGVTEWVATFDRFVLRAQAAEKCRSACDVSGTSWSTGLSDFTGKGGVPYYCGSENGASSGGCFSDVVLLPLKPIEARRRVEAMRRERWTSESTRGVIIEVNTYNPNYDMATVLRIMMDATAGGLLVPHVEIWSCRLTLTGNGIDTFRFMLEIIFAAWLAYYFFIEFSEMYKERLEYFSDMWNYIELANLTAYVFTMLSWFFFVYGHDFDSFRKRDVDGFRDLYPVAKEFNLGTSLASFNLVYGFVRFFKYFRISAKFRMFWSSLAQSLQIILPLLFAYACFLVGFAFSGHWLFGQRVRVFSSLSGAVLYLVLSVKDGIDYTEIQDAAPAAAALWYFGWYMLSKVIVLGLIVAPTIVVFGGVLRQSQAQETSRRLAVESGARIPTLSSTFQHDYLPAKKKDGKGGHDKEAMEAQENHRELKEALAEVDIEKLWSRVMQGVLDDEVALDAAELKFLFGRGTGKTAEKAARHFINRVCNLAQLGRVENPVVRTNKDEIASLERKVERMESHIDSSKKVLQKRFQKLGGFLALGLRKPEPPLELLQLETKEATTVFKDDMQINGRDYEVKMVVVRGELRISALDGEKDKTLEKTIKGEEFRQVYSQARGNYSHIAARLRQGVEFTAVGERVKLELGPPALDIVPAFKSTASERPRQANTVFPKGAVKPPLKGQLCVASAMLDSKKKGGASTIDASFEEMRARKKPIDRFLSAEPTQRKA